MNCKLLLLAPLVLAIASRCAADEAISPTGKKHVGTLVQEKGVWIFRTTAGRDLPLPDLQQIRFAERPIPISRAPLTHVLCLPHEQRISGSLANISDKAITFLTGWGKMVTIDRSRAMAILHANDAGPILREDFEGDLTPWQSEGKPRLDRERAYFGKASLRLDAAGQRLARTWKPAIRDGSVRLMFFDADVQRKLATAFEVLLDKASKPGPRFLIAGEGYRCLGVTTSFGAAKRAAGWHLLAVDIDGGRLRVFVDDACLGQTTVSAGDAIHGLRIVQDAGEIWIDEMSVTRKLQPMTLPTAGDQDAVWLEQGEQLFGRIVDADANRVHLEAKFGKRALPWSRVRGILFAQAKKTPPVTEPEIQFSPGPGFSLDLLRARLIRWDGEKLMVDHPLLGEVPIERERLRRIRFVMK
ncbi:MAG TPA: hypothetical protein VFE62_19325 [Gemmataceae bacterium]|nr:hypothetical protein [Gemmataceae bacterium]